MSDRLTDLEAKLGEMTASIRQLENRVAVLEQRRGAAAAAVPGAAPRRAPAPARDASGAGVAGDLAALTGNLALVGRTLLVLAGAFLLRAITDTGAIPAWLGVALGCAYAGAWIALADRIGAAAPWSAAFHGVSAILVGFPLLVEAVTRFRILPAPAAVAVLTVFTAIALAVAARRRLHLLAWLIEAGGILTAIALMVATGQLAAPVLYLGLLGVAALWMGYVLDWTQLRWPIALVADLALAALMAATGQLAAPVLYLALLGVAALWMGYVLDWTQLRWPIALVADLALAALTLRAAGATASEGPGTALVLQVLVVGLYLGSIATRTLLLRRAVVDFEVVQTAALLAVGLGGASYVTVHAGMNGAAVGIASLVFGAGVYATAFAFVERQRGRANFQFYGAVALVFVLAGAALLLDGPALSSSWAVLGVTAALLSRRLRRQTLLVHGCVYALAAAVQSGAIAYAATAVVSSVGVPWPAPSPALPIVVVALGVVVWCTRASGPEALQPVQRIPRCATIAALAIAATGVVLGRLVPLLAGAPGPGASAGAAATTRTAVLVAGTLLLAWAGREGDWREAGWLAWPVLVITGLKLLLEDVPRSPPATLFVAFGAYGAALILVPRLRRRTAAAPAAHAEAPAARAS